VHELGLGHRVEKNRREIGEFHAHRLVVELGADGILHPAVGDQDPQRGKVRAQRDEKRHHQMLHFGKSLPAEKKQPDERRLENERHQPFDGKRNAENVAHVMRVVGPIGTELEFQRQAGGHAHHEIDAKQQAPEARHVAVDLAVGHHADRFHDDQNPDNPSVSGTKRKWYSAVTANWSRDTSTRSRSGMRAVRCVNRRGGRVDRGADALPSIR
jgi:hypothetical protein